MAGFKPEPYFARGGNGGKKTAPGFTLGAFFGSVNLSNHADDGTIMRLLEYWDLKKTGRGVFEEFTTHPFVLGG
ncbi:MAG: hypothetical protein NTW26_01145 [bacterium]|nr:hypothetical protein [bacterium]